MITDRMKEKLNKFKPLNSVLEYSKPRLLLHHPYKVLYYYFYKNLVYKKTLKGKLKKANTFFGDPMQVMIPAGLDIYLFGLKSHPSEIALSQYIIKTLKEGDSMIDIGAHFGYFTMLASHVVGNTGKVYSIEASPETFQVLKLNTNALKNVQPLNLAISDQDNKTIEFTVFPIFYSEMNTINPGQYENVKWFSKTTSRVVQIPSLTLGGLMDKYSIDPKIVKIDVEGAEGAIIRGALEKLKSVNGLSLILEFVNDDRLPGPYEEAEGMLTSIGYHPHYIQINGNLERIDQPILEFMKRRNLVSENITFLKTT